MAYLLDANVFIQAKNLHYGLDFCPAFWDWLVAENSAGVVFSVEKVGAELVAGNDALSPWAHALGAQFFVPPGNNVQAAMAALTMWAVGRRSTQGHPYDQAALATFLQGPDYFLVAQAQMLGYTVVTMERPEPESRHIVKIPDACLGVGVNWTSPYQMLRDRGARFVLGQAAVTP